MSAIPHVAIAYDNGISGHFSGVDLDHEGYWIEFSLREGLDGSDLVVLRAGAKTNADFGVIKSGDR